MNELGEDRDNGDCQFDKHSGIFTGPARSAVSVEPPRTIGGACAEEADIADRPTFSPQHAEIKAEYALDVRSRFVEDGFNLTIPDL